MKTKVFAATEVAYILRQALGSLREWSDCLADMRRDKTSVEGLQLLPTGMIHDGRAWRPAYDGASIAEFIRAVRTLRPELPFRPPIEGFEVDLDPSDSRMWKLRKLSAKILH